MTLQPPNPNVEFPLGAEPTPKDLRGFAKKMQEFQDFICQQFPVRGGNVAVGTKWVAPAFLNSWANYEAGQMPAAYRKGVDGRVTIRGLVKHPGATGVSIIFMLPSAYRPSENLIFVGWSGSGGGGIRVDVTAAGEVRVFGPAGETDYLSINLSFYPD